MKSCWLVAVWISVLALQFLSNAEAYKISEYDHDFLKPVRNKIQQLVDDGDKETLISLASRLEETSHSYPDDSRTATVLRYLRGYVMRQFDIAVSGTGTLEAYRSEESDLLSYADDQQVEQEQQFTAPTDAHEKKTANEFYNTYRGFVMSDDVDLPEQCFTYYNEIDQIAQANDFPTALIIAMRYREHTCYFDNPANGRGNFQITSHYYEPGEITWDEFAEQIQNFINFSRAKRARYDNLQLWDEESIELTYDSFDLQWVRKHAILYNGIKTGTTPETNDYANHNFGDGPDGKDGIVAAFLKVLKWQIEHN